MVGINIKIEPVIAPMITHTNGCTAPREAAPALQANAAIGTLFLHFNTYEEAEYAVQNSNQWLKIKVA